MLIPVLSESVNLQLNRDPFSMIYIFSHLAFTLLANKSISGFPSLSVIFVKATLDNSISAVDSLRRDSKSASTFSAEAIYDAKIQMFFFFSQPSPYILSYVVQIF